MNLMMKMVMKRTWAVMLGRAACMSGGSLSAVNIFACFPLTSVHAGGTTTGFYFKMRQVKFIEVGRIYSQGYTGHKI